MKKKLLLGLSFVGVAALAASVGTTLAVLSHETTTTKNTMTVGRAQIEQLEYQRAVDADGNWISTQAKDEYGYTPDKLETFAQNKKLIPTTGTAAWDDRNGSQAPSGEGSHQQSWANVDAPGSNQLFDDSVTNVIDKFVFVKNTGDVDVYYRTIIAIEAPEGNDEMLHLNENGNQRFDWDQFKDGKQNPEEADEMFVTFNNTRYLVRVATHTEALEPDSVSRPSLLQFFLDKDTTSEQMEKYEDTFEVLVLSQAVQADSKLTAQEMLEAEFGQITEQTDFAKLFANVK